MEIIRTFDIVSKMLAEYPKEDALAVKRFGKWEKFSTAEYRKLVDYFSYGLLALGVKKGDKIFSVSNNRPEWNIMDMGMSQVGAVHVPVYPNNSDEEYLHILSHSDSRFAFVSSEAFYQKIKPLADATPNVEKVYCIDKVEGADLFDDIIALGEKKPKARSTESHSRQHNGRLPGFNYLYLRNNRTIKRCDAEPQQLFVERKGKFSFITG